MEELKPCPFCGLTPKRICEYRRNDGAEINISYYCNHNDLSAMEIVRTGRFGKDEWARECWNKRCNNQTSKPIPPEGHLIREGYAPIKERK